MTKALNAQRVTVEDVVDYSDSLLELPAHQELHFNFNNVTINTQEGQDEVDHVTGKILLQAVVVRKDGLPLI